MSVSCCSYYKSVKCRPSCNPCSPCPSNSLRVCTPNSYSCYSSGCEPCPPETKRSSKISDFPLSSGVASSADDDGRLKSKGYKGRTDSGISRRNGNRTGSKRNVYGSSSCSLTDRRGKRKGRSGTSSDEIGGIGGGGKSGKRGDGLGMQNGGESGAQGGFGGQAGLGGGAGGRFGGQGGAFDGQGGTFGGQGGAFAGQGGAFGGQGGAFGGQGGAFGGQGGAFGGQGGAFGGQGGVFGGQGGAFGGQGGVFGGQGGAFGGQGGAFGGQGGFGGTFGGQGQGAYGRYGGSGYGSSGMGGALRGMLPPCARGFSANAGMMPVCTPRVTTGMEMIPRCTPRINSNQFMFPPCVQNFNTSTLGESPYSGCTPRNPLNARNTIGENLYSACTPRNPSRNVPNYGIFQQEYTQNTTAPFNTIDAMFGGSYQGSICFLNNGILTDPLAYKSVVPYQAGLQRQNSNSPFNYNTSFKQGYNNYNRGVNKLSSNESGLSYKICGTCGSIKRMVDHDILAQRSQACTKPTLCFRQM